VTSKSVEFMTNNMTEDAWPWCPRACSKSKKKLR
jgi:hypothetical protein